MLPYFYPLIGLGLLLSEIRPRWVKKMLDYLKIVVRTTNSLKISDQNISL